MPSVIFGENVVDIQGLEEALPNFIYFAIKRAIIGMFFPDNKHIGMQKVAQWLDARPVLDSYL